VLGAVEAAVDGAVLGAVEAPVDGAVDAPVEGAVLGAVEDVVPVVGVAVPPQAARTNVNAMIMASSPIGRAGLRRQLRRVCALFSRGSSRVLKQPSIRSIAVAHTLWACAMFAVAPLLRLPVVKRIRLV
jgi:hypothetical protein